MGRVGSASRGMAIEPLAVILTRSPPTSKPWK